MVQKHAFYRSMPWNMELKFRYTENQSSIYRRKEEIYSFLVLIWLDFWFFFLCYCFEKQYDYDVVFYGCSKALLAKKKLFHKFESGKPTWKDWSVIRVYISKQTSITSKLTLLIVWFMNPYVAAEKNALLFNAKLTNNFVNAKNWLLLSENILSRHTNFQSNTLFHSREYDSLILINEIFYFWETGP